MLATFIIINYIDKDKAYSDAMLLQSGRVTTFAHSFNDQVHFLFFKTIGQVHFRDTGVGQAKGFPAGTAVKMNVKIVMAFAITIFFAKCIFGGPCTVFYTMDEAFFFEGF